jgi:hypothetical protein
MNFHIHPMLSLRIHETLFCRLVALKISTGLAITMAKIIDAIKKVENETLPYKKFKRHVKPYWNDNLTSLRDSMRTHRINWINNCHCYSQTCTYFQRYKSTKKCFVNS